MSAELIERQEERTLADLIKQIGGVPLERVRAFPPPGAATEAELVRLSDRQDRLFELVDGVLVEKAMSYYESLLAAVLIRILGVYVQEHNLGIVLGADAQIRLLPQLVRMPDVSFLSWAQFPRRKLPRTRVLGLAPDLAVEIISPSNTRAEMERKLQEYFAAGVRLVWYLYPETQTVEVFTGLSEHFTLTAEDTLDGGAVVPGFRLPVRQWFSEAGEREDEDLSPADEE